MADPCRQQILDDIESTLKGIRRGTVPTGSTVAYSTDIRSVVRRKDTPPEVETDDLPQIQIWKGTTTYEERPGKQIFAEMEFDLFVLLTDGSEDLTDDAIDAVRDDIIAALYVDIQRGGAAYRTRLIDDFEGVHEDETLGQLRMRWAVNWHRSVIKS